MKPGLDIMLDSKTTPADLGAMGSVTEVRLVRDAIGDRKMPAVVLVVEVDGKPHQVAMSLRLFRMASLALCTRMAEERGEQWYFEPGETNPSGTKN